MTRIGSCFNQVHTHKQRRVVGVLIDVDVDILAAAATAARVARVG